MDQKKLFQFLSFWVVDVVVLLVASLIFKNNVVLGNDKVSTALAAVVCGFIITVLITLVDPAVKKSDFKVKNENLWAVIYFVVNALGIWVLKRFALMIGLGVSNLFFVAILALILTVAQWGAALANGSMKKS